MELKNSHFKYSTVLKNDTDLKFDALELFPNLSEISFESRSFSSYAECIRSCKGMMEDLSSAINLGAQESKFKVGAEVNPKHSGTASISKDWGEAEIARFWIYEKSMESSPMKIAVGRSSVQAIEKADRLLN